MLSGLQQIEKEKLMTLDTQSDALRMTGMCFESAAERAAAATQSNNGAAMVVIRSELKSSVSVLTRQRPPLVPQTDKHVSFHLDLQQASGVIKNFGRLASICSTDKEQQQQQQQGGDKKGKKGKKNKGGDKVAEAKPTAAAAPVDKKQDPSFMKKVIKEGGKKGQDILGSFLSHHEIPSNKA